MGYRFSLETANTVANLAFGKVLSCYRDIFSTENRYLEFKEFLDTFDENLFLGDKHYNYSDDEFERMHRHHYQHMKDIYLNRREFYHEAIKGIKECLDIKQNNNMFAFNDGYKEFDNNRYLQDRELIERLGILSDIIKQCRIKSLLLPKPYLENNTDNDEFMTDVRTLERLLHWHPYDSCLILQPKERPNSNNITIFDVFPNFDFALRQLDLWPAVMFWNNRKDFIFTPINHIDELETMYAIMHYEKRDSFCELRKFISGKIKSPVPHYYLHLSDFHFGHKKTTLVKVRRLRKLIDNQIASFSEENSEITVNFVITGDIIDSPNPKNTNEYYDFHDFVSKYSSNPNSPLMVLGNHDINAHGLALGKNNQSLINSIGQYPKIEIDDDIKVIFLLFNSNVKGSLAEGEIGTEQLSEMGNKLDKIENLSDYKMVAVLHHHLIKIPKPEWLKEPWYKKFIPTNFLEKALRLRDADIFKEWLNRRNVKLVLHGHKHVPFIGKDGGITIVACGSSTGKIENIHPQKTYISYNTLKFNKDTVTCTLYVEDILGSGARRDNKTAILNY